MSDCLLFGPFCSSTLQPSLLSHMFLRLAGRLLHAEQRAAMPPPPVARKKCGHCGQELPEAEFWRDKHRKDSLRAYCSRCMRAYEAACKGRASWLLFYQINLPAGD